MPDVDEDMQEFLSYVENTTDAFAKKALSPLIQEIHRRVKEVKESKEMEVEYMTLLQRDRENIELGREEGLEIGREEGREEGLELGRKEGLELGREEGRENMALLINVLITENRIEDLRRASEDAGFREKLLREYHIL